MLKSRTTGFWEGLTLVQSFQPCFPILSDLLAYSHGHQACLTPQALGFMEGEGGKGQKGGQEELSWGMSPWTTAVRFCPGISRVEQEHGKLPPSAQVPTKL